MAVKEIGRAIGLDVHLDFCEIAICEDGKVRSAGRVASTPEALKVLAESLLATDRVALEVTGSSWEILRILEPHVERVIVVSPDDTGIRQARAKTDRLDSRTLAKLCGVVSLTGCGRRMSSRGCCAAGWRAVSSWCGRDRAPRTRFTRC
jgi:hypothetical protein